jgi:hypothetical protein
MAKDWLVRLAQATYLTITIAAVCQELEKPSKRRTWRGKIGLIPYDFRLPTLERFKRAFWNDGDDRIFTPEPLGIGWAVNIHSVLERLRLISEAYLSEDDFLMPNPSLRRVLENRPVPEQA